MTLEMVKVSLILLIVEQVRMQLTMMTTMTPVKILTLIIWKTPSPVIHVMEVLNRVIGIMTMIVFSMRTTKLQLSSP